MKNYFLFFTILLSIGSLSSCDKNRIFETNTDFTENAWPINEAPEFTFQITDTTARYDIYFNIRNAISYQYYNLYLRHKLSGPDGKTISELLHEAYLMDKRTGKPLGKGAGDIFDHKILAIKNQKFDRVGDYKLRLTQYMRKDPLPGIMAVGIRVEKKD
jgi:gliding motility-associated lipoprotein GldH